MFFRTVEVSLRNQILRERLTLRINILFACLMTHRCSSWKREEKRLLLTLHVTILNSLLWQWVSKYMYTWANLWFPTLQTFYGNSTGSPGWCNSWISRMRSFVLRGTHSQLPKRKLNSKSLFPGRFLIINLLHSISF